MRAPVDALNLRTFMRELARLSGAEGRAYLTGGATSVLLGWRETTMDVDLKVIPDSGSVLTAIRDLKETLNINVEFASPDDFIPELLRYPAITPAVLRRAVETTIAPS